MESRKTRASLADHAGKTSEPAAPVDLTQLARQTGADQALEREVLGLYLARCPIDLGRLKSAASPDERRQIAHLMAGSAGAIGAGTVAKLAAAIERKPNADPGAIVALEAAVEDAKRFIAAHLARPLP